MSFGHGLNKQVESWLKQCGARDGRRLSHENVHPPLLDRINFLKTPIIANCTTFHRYPIFSTRYSVMCKVYTGYCGTSEIEHGLCACTVDNPLAKARGLSLCTGAQTMLYLSLVVWPMEFPLKYHGV